MWSLLGCIWLAGEVIKAPFQLCADIISAQRECSEQRAQRECSEQEVHTEETPSQQLFSSDFIALICFPFSVVVFIVGGLFLIAWKFITVSFRLIRSKQIRLLLKTIFCSSFELARELFRCILAMADWNAFINGGKLIVPLLKSIIYASLELLGKTVCLIFSKEAK
jgi:hypothetical protein